MFLGKKIKMKKIFKKLFIDFIVAHYAKKVKVITLDKETRLKLIYFKRYHYNFIFISNIYGQDRQIMLT